MIRSLPSARHLRFNGVFAPSLFAMRRLLFAFLIFTCSWATAQTGEDEVHIVPRAPSAAPASARHAIRANVDLVLVDVTVVDHNERAVTGLQATDFTLLDDGRPQFVKYISNVDEPISLLVVMDASASMGAKIQQERNAIKELINSSNSQDDFSLVIIRDEPRVISHFGDSVSEMQQKIGAIQPDGVTALWDGMYLAIQELRNATYRRRAMIVISDGGDNNSRYTQSELKSLLQEADIELYAIGLFDRNARRIEEKMGPLQLDELASITGGRMFPVYDSTEFSRIVNQISGELRNQYVLGYYPSNRNRDGKWRKLKIRFSAPASRRNFRLYAKKGYYAPGE
jgi:Ca-activated chloride channel family protein